MKNENIMMSGRAARETRLIKSTSKRQITIPKSFFDCLAIEDGITFVAQVIDDGIFLKPQPVHGETVNDQDRKCIIRKVLQEGYSGEEMVEEISFRLQQYDEFIARRLREFENDIADSVEGADVIPGVEAFNGLDIFFDQKD